MVSGRKELISKLKQDILQWQGIKPPEAKVGEGMGLGQMESAFPNAIFPRKAIHEFISILPEHSAASDGFIGGLLSILMKEGGACIWVSTSRKLFPVSLRRFNVDPERIIFMDVAREKDVLWIMEESLKCEGLAAVVAELNVLSLVESRRLQLAVEKSGITGFIVRKDARKALSTLVSARWRITPLPSAAEDGMPGIGFPRWKVELTKVRNGNPGSWIFGWEGERFVEVEAVQQENICLDEEERQIG